MNNQQPIEEYLLKILRRWEKCGTFVCSPDGHLFFQPCKAITTIHGALDMKKESAAVGARIVLRRVKYRPKHSRYAKLPWYQVYILPITEKMVAASTDAERANRELNKRAMSLAHAVENDPDQAAVFHRLHQAHIAEHQAHPSCPPAGYKKFYPSFYGFVYATIRLRLAAEASVPAPSECLNSVPLTPEFHSGIALCAPSPSSFRARSVSCASYPRMLTPRHRPRAA